MIIEFNGLSGIGKTTIAHELGALYISKGYDVHYYYNIKESRIKRYLEYILDGSLWLWIIGCFFASKSIHPKDRRRKKYVMNIVAFYRMYRVFQKVCPEAILIIDQGILQAISSIVHMDEIHNSAMLRKLFAFLKRRGIHFVSVNCQNDPTLSFERLRVRNSVGRWESYSDKKLECGLRRQIESFSLIRECARDTLRIDELTLNTALPASDNARVVFNYING